MEHTTDIDEQSLINRITAYIRSGDRRAAAAAYAVLVKRYSPQVFGFISKMTDNQDDIKDLAQNTFIKAWRSLDRFRLESTLYTWLFRIATNEALTFVRRSNKSVALSINDDDMKITLPANDMESSETGDEIAEKLQSAVEKLPEKQKIVFKMKYYKEMKYDDMAGILKTSVGALKASYHFAVKKIENFLSIN
jgi:RNA polymerase sigma-70 factor (ECF subfamily)